MQKSENVGQSGRLGPRLVLRGSAGGPLVLALRSQRFLSASQILSFFFFFSYFISGAAPLSMKL